MTSGAAYETLVVEYPSSEISMTFLAQLVVLGSVLLAPVPKQRVINPETIAAFEKLGATYGTIRTATNGRMEFTPATEGIEPGGLPAFRIIGPSKGPYPEVNVPFGLVIWTFPGNLLQFAKAKNLTSIIAQSTPLFGPDLETLSTLPDLRRLRIENGSSYTDDLFHEVGRLPLLESLDINAGLYFTVEGRKKLGNLKNLRVLLLRSVNISYAELIYLNDPKQLRSLDLSVGKNEDLVHLKSFENLESLSLDAHFNGYSCRYDDGAIEALRPLKKLRQLNLQNTLISDAGMRTLAEFTELRELNLADTKVTDRGIRELAKLTNLERLDLSRTFSTGSELAAFENLERLDHAEAPFGEAGGKSLESLQKLTHLNLARTPLAATSFRSIAGLPALVSLNLTKTPITDETLKAMRSLPTLQRLILSSTLVTDDGVKALRACQSLTHLDLYAAKLTDASIKALGELPGLIELNLGRTNVTDKELDVLVNMKSLYRTYLHGTKVTDEARKALQAAHPKRSFW